MKPLHSFALLLHYESLTLIDAEHGVIVSEAPLAAPAGRPGKWLFGPDAEAAAGRMHLFATPHFPLAEYFAWFLSRFYPLRRLKLLLLSAEPMPPLNVSLWEHLFAGLGLPAPLQLRSPLAPLAAARQRGLLVYLADGVAQLAVCRKGQIDELSQAGYGYFLTRAVRQHVLAQQGLQIDVPTAEQAWLRLGACERQLTLEGSDAEGRPRRLLLIAEELRPAFAAAFEPLLREIVYLAALHPNLPLQLYGSHADWLLRVNAEAGTLALADPLVLTPDAERILIHSIQHYLRGMA
ncbi:MAG: hypothetical protein CVV27_10805 [Candidatus Melainabacteria bacterium HGW-Melainabacteria-1]|nr:MAG: hypothetical protein CVV27_10805 [Candidatus Melainabacteria bacterium HGW-Melainabacteria-1]